MAGSRALQTACGRDASYVKELDGCWCFGGELLTVKDALNADYGKWEKITVPHTWNAVDGENGADYKRTLYWYHKEFNLDTDITGKRVYIEFLGVNAKAVLYVNGEKAGDVHKL